MMQQNVVPGGSSRKCRRRFARNDGGVHGQKGRVLEIRPVDAATGASSGSRASGPATR